MVRIASKLVQQVLIVLCTLLFLQFPLFIQAYQQQLTGHVAEIRIHVNRMREMAASSKKTLEQYIQKFIDNSDEDFSRQGGAMRQMHVRSLELSKALKQLQEASVLKRPFIFLAYLDRDIALSTAHSFQPGIPLTLEGFCYAFFGMILAFLGCGFFSKMSDRAAFNLR